MRQTSRRYLVTEPQQRFLKLGLCCSKEIQSWSLEMATSFPTNITMKELFYASKHLQDMVAVVLNKTSTSDQIPPYLAHDVGLISSKEKFWSLGDSNVTEEAIGKRANGNVSPSSIHIKAALVLEGVAAYVRYDVTAVADL
jgi:hypothetical protein